jgi:tRNA A-37 threonylcarbamoyl transferase component Bud32
MTSSEVGAITSLKTVDHQDFLVLRGAAEVLEFDSHGEKVLRLADGSILKLFRRKRLLSSAAYSPYAQRFADNAAALARLGIPVPRVIEVMRIPSIKRDAVHYHPLPGTSLRELVRQQATPSAATSLKAGFSEFVVQLHDKGIYFRSLHLGNVILTPTGSFGLIDFADLKIYPGPLSGLMRLRNIKHLLRIASERDWIDREAILGDRRSMWRLFSIN